jgi:ferredoxin
MGRFAPVEDVAAHTAGGTFTVRLAKTGGEYEAKEAESILDALLAGGVEAPCSCQQGICGACIVRVLAGKPDHRDDILTDRERADGMFTTCSSRAHSPIVEFGPMTDTFTATTKAVEAVEQLEAAWPVALVEGEKALIPLLLEDSRVVHGPVGRGRRPTSRFYDFLSRHEGHWTVVRRQPIYEKDRLDVVDPAACLTLDPELLSRFPTGYRHLAYLQTKAGFTVKDGLPGLTGAAVQQLYSEGEQWLAKA